DMLPCAVEQEAARALGVPLDVRDPGAPASRIASFLPRPRSDVAADLGKEGERWLAERVTAVLRGRWRPGRDRASCRRLLGLMVQHARRAWVGGRLDPGRPSSSVAPAPGTDPAIGVAALLHTAVQVPRNAFLSTRGGARASGSTVLEVPLVGGELG